MNGAHGHVGMPSIDVLPLSLAAIAIACYLGGVVASARRGRPWPWYRSALWCAGIVAGAASVAGPLAVAGRESFVAHTWAHLLVGMLAPLLLVLAAPVTLALRTLSVTPARRLSRLLNSAPARVLAHPVTAAVLSVGGLWVVYATPVFAAMRMNPLLHLLVPAHMLAAGYLLTAALIGPDPRPHARSRPLGAAVLVLTMAGHGILAKHLYAHPPAGVALAEAREGAQLMYYAGAWIEAAVIVVFCAQWYAAAGRASAAERRRWTAAGARPAA